MSTFADVRKKASLPTSVVSLCLAGELVEQYADLERQYAEAKPSTSIGEASPKRVIAEQMEAVRELMQESMQDFHLRAFGARSWSVFWGSIPTRGEKENQADWEPRIFPYYAELVARSCTSPEMTTEEVAELADILHHRAWSDLVQACMGLNTGAVDVPNFAAASELIGTSEQM